MAISNDLLLYRVVILSYSQFFLTSQFLIEGYSKPYSFYRNRNGGGVLIYIREDIPSKPLTDHTLPHDIEEIFVELI